ncbi:hypothetical protein HanXRQr2_Chr01g0040991 [Helianthus annuus]|uniref:Uncharacterized protein n=1 Tax=Helianthus annuus TaxID=4232 RepID=A0A251UA52_HELAN|nr:hypothetical protein HanXRQr2_Chr01g0040991 [Helianthus annuus]KAJ0958513.1 hypothetical protein HanPSC8_Chr01g0039801 [Helianthus annuus]
MLVTYFHLFRFQQVLGLETEIRLLKSLDLESLVFWWNRDYRDDGPPGVDRVIGSLPSSFSPRYPGYDSKGLSYRRRSTLIRDDDQWPPYASDSSSHRREP